jgi:hypothetical protein
VTYHLGPPRAIRRSPKLEAMQFECSCLLTSDVFILLHEGNNGIFKHSPKVHVISDVQTMDETNKHFHVVAPNTNAHQVN